MNTTLNFVSSARWTKDRNGVVTGRDVQPTIDFSAPPEFQGEPGIWTPEHFFTAAVATCFINTFTAIATFSKFSAAALEVAVDGQIEKLEGGYRFTRVTIRPALTVQNDSDRDRGLRLLEKAEKACLVSRSLQSEIVLDPRVVVAPALATV
ncbi:MAG TPA: OsmC family protein [Candidatus Sulfotelmatobacter sp.]|nr:OsmC family protein [Candidatus Sulfotelmatobacter sp.]